MRLSGPLLAAASGIWLLQSPIARNGQNSCPLEVELIPLYDTWVDLLSTHGVKKKIRRSTLSPTPKIGCSLNRLETRFKTISDSGGSCRHWSTVLVATLARLFFKQEMEAVIESVPPLMIVYEAMDKTAHSYASLPLFPLFTTVHFIITACALRSEPGRERACSAAILPLDKRPWALSKWIILQLRMKLCW